MKFYSLSVRVVFLVLILVSAHAAALAIECPTCQTSFTSQQILPNLLIAQIASGDFNGDSNPDLVALKFFSNEVMFLAGDGTGNFASPVNFTVGSNPKTLTVADFDLDGKSDLAITDFSANNVLILLGNGKGSFTLHATLDVASRPD